MNSSLVEIVIQNENYEVKPGLLQGSQLLQLTNITQPCQLLLEIDDDIDIPLLADDHIVIDGGERFSIGDGDPPIVDNPCMRVPIRFEFNGKKIDKDNALKQPKVLGSDLKRFDPDSDPSDGLFAELDGLADEPIQNNWHILVQRTDHFITTPCGNVGYVEKPQGIVGRHLAALESEYENVEWHSHPAGNTVIIRNFQLPSHWSVPTTDLMTIVPNGYPVAALDMFYVNPEIRLLDGRIPDRGDHFENHLGEQWQRFSWHYQSRKWNPAKDTLLSHIRFCQNRLNMAL